MSKDRFNWRYAVADCLEELFPAKPAPERKMIDYTPEMARRLKAAYTEACKIKTKDETFMFDGNEYVLGYAKYLIEYLETKFGEL